MVLGGCRSSLLLVTTFWRPTEVHQHGGSILGSVNLCTIFRQIFEVWENVQT